MPARTIRDTMRSLLEAKGVPGPVSDTDSLFVSGRLDSLAATEVLMMLEGDFGIDLSDADFDIARLDTIADLEALVAGKGLN
jgi:acyl carrier protein